MYFSRKIHICKMCFVCNTVFWIGTKMEQFLKFTEVIQLQTK